MPPYERLLYRRQFLLAPHVLDAFPSWTHVPVGAGTFHVYAHPDLTCTQARRGELEATLLGFGVDPDVIGADEASMLDRLLQGIDSPSQAMRGTERWGGRWILIMDDGEKTILFTDPSGLRQTHYRTAPEGTWCATQGRLLAEVVDLAPDPGAEQFLRSDYVKNKHEYWWPGDSSLYASVRRLLPNHVLDLRSGTVTRFWPWAERGRVPVEEAAADVSDLLRRLLLSANERFDLAPTMTAGLDSRTILAATRDIRHDMFYHTYVYWDLNRNSPDVCIPRKLLRRLELEHRAIRCPNTMDPDFRSAYERNFTDVHEAWGVIAEGIREQYPSDHVSVKGNCAEISRCVYTKPGRKEVTKEWTIGDVDGLLRGFYLGEDPFSRKHIRRWYEGAAEAQRSTGYDFRDLFYWEQRMGSWQATGQAEWDLVQEVFTPFNCRYMHETLLQVDEAYRSYPDYSVFWRMIERLWPETLSEPINPVPLTKQVRAFMRKHIRPRVGETVFYRVLRTIYQTLKAAT